jgi:hypothetical protein
MQGVLLDLLALCAATTVDIVRLKTDMAECDRLRHAGGWLPELLRPAP